MEHATERLGLFVVIVLGESIFTIVSELAQDWNPGPALTSALGFLIVALLGWAFFQYGMDVLAMGLEQLRNREDFSGILQTTLFIPFALVRGVTSIAAAIATAIPAPNTLLPPGAAVALDGGLALSTAPMRSSRCASARRCGQCCPGPFPPWWPRWCWSRWEPGFRPSRSRGKRRPRPPLSGIVRCPGGPASRSNAGC